MSGFDAGLQAHLASGTTTLARLWRIERRDGIVLGFTDHDRDLLHEGVLHLADHGLSASALQHSTGFAVDNSEGSGALSSDMIREEDIAAGRYDGAKVLIQLVNWADLTQSLVLFHGTLGEVTRSGGAFRAELRGLAEALNQPQGQVYQRPCSAVLGDARCRVDLSLAVFDLEAEVSAVTDNRLLSLAVLDSHAERWFEAGRMTVLDGAAAGLLGVIKNDRLEAGARVIELWEALRAEVAVGTRIRLEAGCDKRAATCRMKFNNMANHRGFPFMPGEDWLSAVPANQPIRNGGSLWSGR